MARCATAGRFLDDDVAALSGQTPKVPAVVGAAATAGVGLEAGVPVQIVVPQIIAPQSGSRPSDAHLSGASKTKETIE